MDDRKVAYYTVKSIFCLCIQCRIPSIDDVRDKRKGGQIPARIGGDMTSMKISF